MAPALQRAAPALAGRDGLGSAAAAHPRAAAIPGAMPTRSFLASFRHSGANVPFVGLLPSSGASSASCQRRAARLSCVASGKQPQVVLTREKGKNEKLRSALESRGIAVLELPLIEHRHGPDLHLLHELLREPSKIPDWIAITSPEAAAVFLEAWREERCPAVRLTVVGGGTADAFKGLSAEESSRLSVDFTPSKATAKTLAAELPLSDGASTSVLYPASVKASHDLQDGLAERGFSVARLNTYSTESVSNVDPAVLSLASGTPVATFASPTAVRAWIELVQPFGWDGAAACIGETSATAARKAGMQRVYHPDKPGIEGWVHSVIEALDEQSKVLSV